MFLFVPVNLIWIKGPLSDESKGGGVPRFHYAVEAGASPGMTCSGTLLVNMKDEGVLITVGADLKNPLGMSGGCALVPDLLPAAGVVDGFAQKESLPEGFLIHPRKHQRFVGLSIEGNGGNKSISIKLGAELIGLIHGGLALPGAKADSLGGILIAHGREAGAMKRKEKGGNEGNRCILRF